MYEPTKCLLSFEKEKYEAAIQQNWDFGSYLKGSFGRVFSLMRSFGTLCVQFFSSCRQFFAPTFLIITSTARPLHTLLAIYSRLVLILGCLSINPTKQALLEIANKLLVSTPWSDAIAFGSFFVLPIFIRRSSLIQLQNAYFRLYSLAMFFCFSIFCSLFSYFTCNAVHDSPAIIRFCHCWIKKVRACDCYYCQLITLDYVSLIVPLVE